MDWSDVHEVAKVAAGNHLDFDSFAWFDRPDNSEDWTLLYTHGPHSPLTELSNGHVITEELKTYTEGDNPDVIPQHHSHWVVGWVDGLTIRVYDKDRNITPAFRRYVELQAQMEDYPLLDEQDYSDREYEAAVEWIEQEGRRFVQPDAPEDWSEQVYSWLSDNEDRELENVDDTGAAPSEESIRRALEHLSLTDEGDEPCIVQT